MLFDGVRFSSLSVCLSVFVSLRYSLFSQDASHINEEEKEEDLSSRKKKRSSSQKKSKKTEGEKIKLGLIEKRS